MKKESNKKHNRTWIYLGLLLFFFSGFLNISRAEAATALNEPLDKENPVYFYGDTITYQDKTTTLDASNIYIDGSLSDEICSKYPYVYNDFKKAYNDGAIKDGTEAAPMNVYLAPYVYWIDDPDDPEIRQGVNGDKVPYGLWMKVNHLSLNGLTDKPENVVLAVNRGQNAGAIGNFTMFYIDGTGTRTNNLTMGNYCCVDLNYPLKTSLSREKRQTAITQSQLCLTNGSKIMAKNCHFISRLNSCPFVGGNRILFENCHFECTDDSLPTSAVYLGCDFDFYSSKPFYNTTGTGSVMLNCQFHIKHNSSQYLTKTGGIVAIIDSTFYCEKEDQYIGWTPDPSTTLRCIEGNVTVQYDYTDADGNKQQKIVPNYTIDANAPYDNVNITDTEAINAYRITHDGKTIYNVYNLFRGTDDWDPMNQKEIITTAGNTVGKDYTDIPVAVFCAPQVASITNGATRNVSVTYAGFSMKTTKTDTITWSVEDSIKDYITLKDNKDGSCVLTCKNETLTPKKGMVFAKASSGLVGGIYVTAAPETQPAPTFVSNPVLSAAVKGSLEMRYTLSNNGILDDYSSITWYRCSDAAGKDAVAVAVSQAESPLRTYTLSYGDVGYYIKAVIVPRQLCTLAGNEVAVVSDKPVTLDDITASPLQFDTDFSDFAPARQPRLLEGFWTKDVYKAWVTDGSDKTTTSNAWTYGPGEVGYGSEGLNGLLPANRGARMMFTPTAGTYGDMSLTLTVNPEKNAGQGFGSAGQYMDIFIKYDTNTLTGYALRLERISNLDCGVQAALVEYKNDTVTYISNKVTTSAFNAECTISVAINSGKLSASVTTTHDQSEKQIAANLPHSVSLQADVAGNTFGGTGLIITGTSPVGNRVMLNHLTVNWDEKTTTLQNPVAVDLSTTQKEPSTGNDDPSTGNDPSAVEKPSVPSTAPKKGTAFTVKGIRYKITKAAANGKGTVTVVLAKKKKTIKTVKIPAAVSYKKVSYKVTAISAKAFYNCKKLKKISIATKNLKKVGKNAFKGIHKKCVIKIPSSKAAAYKKLLKGKGQAKTVKVKS